MSRLSFGLTLSILSLMLFFLVWNSLPILKSQGITLITGTHWAPPHHFGALPILFGSVVVSVLAAVLIIPLTVSSGILISEFVPKSVRPLMKSVIEILNGIPGVVVGLIGLSVISPIIQNLFGLESGNTLLTAALMLSFMIFPTVLTLIDDRLQQIGADYRQQGLALGMTKMELVTYVLIPQIKSSLLGILTLGLTRAIGETIAVMLVIGSIDRLPTPLFNILSPGQTIPSKIGREAAEAIGSGLHWSALSGLALLLLISVFFLVLVAEQTTKSNA